MKNKKIIILIIAILLIFTFVFLLFNYKNKKIGNTIINKSEKEIVDYILNIKHYKAQLDITIQTNKNKTKYLVNQKYDNKISTQEIIEPANVAGVLTQYDGKKLIIKNNNLNLESTFNNYQYITDNKLWLDSFIADYNKYEDKQVLTKENEIILEVKNTQANKYNTYKKLYIDKKTGIPTKLIIQDINQNTLVYILYTKIEIS